MRYTAYTLDGSPIKTAETAQQLANYVADHLARNLRPHIGYTYDPTAECAFPYTVWKRDDTSGIATIGEPMATFDDVVNWWRAKK